MLRYKALLTAACLAAFIFGMVLTPSVFAYLVLDAQGALAIDADGAKILVDKDNNPLVTAYVSIDRLEYDRAGPGVVYLEGTFFVYNHDQKNELTYDGELRLDISDEDGNTFEPDAKVPVTGSVKKNDEDANWWEVYDSIPKSTNLHMECLSPNTEVDATYTMSAMITLRVYLGPKEETWQVPYSKKFEYEEPQGETGLGATDSADGDTFLGNTVFDECDAIGGNDWHSLIKTEGPYSQVYWYLKAPGDTSAYGTPIETDQGDGVTRKANMTYTFPEDVDDPNKAGDQDGVYYEIIAYVYRWDLSVYTESYKVWVNDKP